MVLLAISVLGLFGNMARAQAVSATSMQPPEPWVAYVNQYVKFTALVSGSVGPATGTVEFFGINSGGKIASTTVVDGVATAYAFLRFPGQYQVYAKYSGDATYEKSDSLQAPAGVQLLSVQPQIATTTSLSVSDSSPSVGQSVTLTAHVEPDANPGTGGITYVRFYDGPTLIGTAGVESFVLRTATLTTSFATAGARAITAVFGGSTNLVSSTSNAVNLTVGKGSTATSASVNPNTAYQDQTVSLSAAVAGVNPTGSVTFKAGGTSIGTAHLISGQAVLLASIPTSGVHSVVAEYSGDDNQLPSASAPATITVQARNATSTSLSAAPGASKVGQPVILTAGVAGGTSPSGTVTFWDGATALGSAPLAANTATLEVSFSSAANRALTASYSGDVPNRPSSSGVTNHVVAKKDSTTALAISPSPLFMGQEASLRASVTGFAPTGSVSFFDGSTALGTAPLTNGAAVLPATFSHVNHTLTASYSGDANNEASTSSQAILQTHAAPPSSATPVVKLEYDANGNPTKTIQAPGVSGYNFATTNTYDALNRLKDSTNAKSGKTQFGYNGREDLTQVTDPRNLVTQYPRNGLGDATSLVSPDTGTATHTYDAAGNLKTRTDSRGVLATYSYDALNRLTGVVYSQSGQTSLSYGWAYDQTGAGYSNGVGRLTSASHPVGSSQYAYDSQGRLLTETQRVNATSGANAAQISSTVGYTYDAAGNLTSLTYPSGRKLIVGYTGGQPTSLGLAPDGSSAASTLISQIQWEPFDGPRSWLWQMASGTQQHTWLYDSSGRLVRQNLGSNLRDISYDAADRITGYKHYDATTGAAQTALDQSFSYDELGRLTGVVTASASWSIGYDANGNRTSVTLNGVASTYTTATTSNRLTSTTNPARSFGYDNAGNTTSDTYIATYNLAGRMATLTKAGTTATYSVDGFGRRVRKFDASGSASTVVFVYDQQGQLLGEYNASGAVIREYVWLGNLPVAVFTPDPANAANPPLVYYIHTDHLNTPRIVVDKSGNQRWNWLAEPFGTTAPNNNPSALGAFTFNLRFPGQYADQESGLFYNYFRDYDASTGRYVQSDPIGLAGGINTYAYVEGNPLRYTDPDGLAPSPGDSSIYPPTHNCTCMTKCKQANHDEAWEACAFGSGTVARITRIPGVGVPVGYVCQKIVVHRICEQKCLDFCSGKAECPPAFRD